jgi:uncharacterized protein involved in type VI secretion and phage assembly
MGFDVDEIFPDPTAPPSRMEELKRQQILDTIMGYVNGLAPGQGLKIVAHDPDKEKDRRHFTLTRLDEE